MTLHDSRPNMYAVCAPQSEQTDELAPRFRTTPNPVEVRFSPGLTRQTRLYSSSPYQGSWPGPPGTSLHPSLPARPTSVTPAACCQLRRSRMGDWQPVCRHSPASWMVRTGRTMKRRMAAGGITGMTTASRYATSRRHGPKVIGQHT